MKITFSADHPASGLVVLPLSSSQLGDGAGKTLDEATGGALTRAIAAADFSGKPGDTLTIPAPGEMSGAVVMLLGLGDDAAKEDPTKASELGGKIAGLAKGKFREVSVLTDGLTVGGASGAALALALAEGARLRGYSFDKYRVRTAKPDEKLVETFTIIGSDFDNDALLAADADAKAVAEGVFLARDLVSEPPNVLHPESYAERLKELEDLGVEIVILDEAKMTELGMGSLLGVGQGSVRESRIVCMVWNGGKSGDAPLALVGKGVTFDTGGISIKPAGGMEDMKFDMGGSAAVAGAMKAIAGRKAKANVVGLVGLVENMPDGNAQRPSDVVTSMSGQTIEVINTDAEGRLVLADVLTYAQKTYAPAAIVDLATLTGAIIIALAHEFAGVFTKDDAFAADLIAAGDAVGEGLWRMPLTKTHDEMIKSDIADMKNVGPREGGSSTAAAFIARFVDEGAVWAHLDIAGTAWTTKDKDVCPKGATGYGVRLLDALVREKFEG